MKWLLLWIIVTAAFSLSAGCVHPPLRSVMKPAGMMPPVITPADYRIYFGDGRPASFDEAASAAGNADAVFIGEEHDDPAAHHLELKFLETLSQTADASVRLHLSLEMFETDVQPVVDEYLNDLISERHFIAAARPWANYSMDYRPLVEFAKTRGIPVIAANAPMRYVNRVSRLGRDALGDLPDAAKGFLAPLPYAGPSDAYREKLRVFWEASAHAGPSDTPVDDDAVRFENFLSAQSLWDATMAHSIATALTASPEVRVMNVNGKFHSEKGLGIPEHLDRYAPQARRLVVTIVSDVMFPEWNPALMGTGDIVIVTSPEKKRNIPRR